VDEKGELLEIFCLHLLYQVQLENSSYEVDPLICPKCQGAMRVIGSIDGPSVIRAILEHLGLWLARARPPPKAHAQWGHDAASCPHECREYAACDLQLQTHADTIYGDPEYSWDAYIHA